jgi:hypothetical protein
MNEAEGAVAGQISTLCAEGLGVMATRELRGTALCQRVEGLSAPTCSTVAAMPLNAEAVARANQLNMGFLLGWRSDHFHASARRNPRRGRRLRDAPRQCGSGHGATRNRDRRGGAARTPKPRSRSVQRAHDGSGTPGQIIETATSAVSTWPTAVYSPIPKTGCCLGLH